MSDPKKASLNSTARNKVIETNSGLIIEEFNNEVLAAQENNIKALLKMFMKPSTANEAIQNLQKNTATKAE